MAQGVVAFYVKLLTESIIEEATFLGNVREQVETLRDDLEWMQSFLQDADTKQESDNRIRQWVSEIRDLVFDAEDTIDNYILKKKRIEPMTRKGIKAAVKNYMFCICRIKLHKIRNDIAAIQKRLNDISSKKEMYGIRNLGEGSSSSLSERLRQSRRSSAYGDEEDITGLDDVVEDLVAQLTGDELQRCVISIVGMGGLGKTSLAKKIYNHTSIKSRFQNRAWVYVSQEYSIGDLLRKIIKSFTTPFNTPSKEVWEMMETVEDLERYLFDFLERKRYLVVLDDVWDSEAWQSLKRAFPNKNKGSRVLLTTRKWNVASSVDDLRNPPPHQLRFLTKEESWELFCNKVFPNNCGDDLTFYCSPGLEMLGRKMVEKCDGLPLGIIVLGGLLSKKQPPSLNEWKRVFNHISQNLMQDKGHIFQILSLSYNDLSYQLKSCFLYMGLFPEDTSIDTEKLIQLWVAEGFIPQGEEPMEDVAKDYLNELIDRSMIQGDWKNWRGVVTCRIHDLLRDLSISKAKEERFLDIFEKVVDSPPLSETSLRRPRRLTIHFDQINRFVSLKNFPIPYIRSILCFSKGRETIQLELFRFIYTNFKLLKILDLDTDTSFQTEPSTLPDSIGEMIHLRYLELKGMRINALPTSIENLQRLQTLKIGGVFSRMPNVIWKMKQLRHLEGDWVDETMRHLKIDTLMNLQTLDRIRDDALIENDLANLTNLRTLSIKVSNSSNVDKLSASLSTLSSLQHLTLRARDQLLQAPIVLESFKCYNLLYLSLAGKFEGLLNNLHQFSPNITELSLQECELKEESMAMLEKLPNLLELELQTNSYIGKEIICLGNGFPRLEVLYMRFLFNLVEWRVEERAMPMLKTLKIEGCKSLEKLPDGLKFLTSLKKLEFQRMPIDFKNRVLQGEDSYKVQHIQSVTFQE